MTASRIQGQLVFGSQNNTPNETNGINSTVSCYGYSRGFTGDWCCQNGD